MAPSEEIWVKNPQGEEDPPSERKDAPSEKR
jgi:hypothetical protein